MNGLGGPKNTAIYASVCLLLMLQHILMLRSRSELKLDPYHNVNSMRETSVSELIVNYNSFLFTSCK